LNTIGLHKLRLFCLVGTLDEEKLTPQELFLNLEVECPAPPSDELLSTVDYTELATLCEEIAASCHHQLLETLAGRIAHALFLRFEIKRLSLRLEKPSAHPRASCAFVHLTRERPR
jgi:7,8-dihydroneopterin aldolase/epimerase/oxygenase